MLRWVKILSSLYRAWHILGMHGQLYWMPHYVSYATCMGFCNIKFMREILLQVRLMHCDVKWFSIQCSIQSAPYLLFLLTTFLSKFYITPVLQAHIHPFALIVFIPLYHFLLEICQAVRQMVWMEFGLETVHAGSQLPESRSSGKSCGLFHPGRSSCNEGGFSDEEDFTHGWAGGETRGHCLSFKGNKNYRRPESTENWQENWKPYIKDWWQSKLLSLGLIEKNVYIMKHQNKYINYDFSGNLQKPLITFETSSFPPLCLGYPSLGAVFHSRPGDRIFTISTQLCCARR